ncbi:uncharacterized protein TNCT_153521 [Trichonephila clavata]|uniref:Uncharacterized protein n=1 Tax=Trichonephila clavata TaxID=2740835 RepID=A0A8X6M2T1_TRICU|nr:uncharacterized protein TNCT_153521 [Trichonephila clavata]
MSVKNPSELEKFMKAATEIMKEGQFDLRGWESNKLYVCPRSSPSTNVLGLIWNKDSDTLKIDSESLKLEEPGTLTKRKILSLTSRIFDPMV